MRTIAEHLAAVLANTTPQPPVLCDVRAALGLTLAADIPARLPVPPFTNSAMDGFLVHSADLEGAAPWTLPVAGDVPAGAPPRALARGTALRIMTGAPIASDPEKLRVIPVEDTDVAPGPGALPTSISIHRISPERRHIRRAGENIAVGDTALAAGTVLDAGGVAAAVSCGITQVQAHPRPRVAVISSGDELLEPGVMPGPGQLPDSNRVMLAALLAEHGITGVTDYHCGDGAGSFRALLDELSATHDLVITTGGISVGAFDVVREVTAPHGVWFGTVAQRPGQHQGAGTWNGVPLVCLPGNPVAAFVSFLLYIPPLLQALAGREPQRPQVSALLTGDGLPARPARTVLAPVRLMYSDVGIMATPFHRHGGSHLVASLADTHGLAVVPPGEERLVAGDPVRVLLRLG
ncbi:MAG: molybdopterin molybdotransferase MoeA [Corynebacterium sp.]|uniref:molybdopterin molybdotransferase MoeA n=1 Tax=Corynebacterium sp. TaxID=1720 RepID=UPI0026DF7DE8|nr:gephyrin-like molybdotransferase Glp [Corynebacterium sp.]MDO5670465.1 molybdopterin molybdotransferase MoeA [Corynebacterium sp.]